MCVWLDVCGMAVCNPDGISEPASLGMIEDYNQMLIGQDSTSTPPASPQIGSDTDVNDVVWVFDFTSMALTRIISAPWGAATASPAWHKAIKAANRKAKAKSKQDHELCVGQYQEAHNGTRGHKL